MRPHAVADDSPVVDWTKGRGRPSLTQFRKLAETLRRAEALFFLPAPPKEDDLTVEFRRSPKETRAEPNASERKSLRDSKRLQRVGLFSVLPRGEERRRRFSASDAARPSRGLWAHISPRSCTLRPSDPRKSRVQAPPRPSGSWITSETVPDTTASPRHRATRCRSRARERWWRRHPAPIPRAAPLDLATLQRQIPPAIPADHALRPRPALEHVLEVSHQHLGSQTRGREDDGLKPLLQKPRSAVAR